MRIHKKLVLNSIQYVFVGLLFGASIACVSTDPMLDPEVYFLDLSKTDDLQSEEELPPDVSEEVMQEEVLSEEPMPEEDVLVETFAQHPSDLDVVELPEIEALQLPQFDAVELEDTPIPQDDATIQDDMMKQKDDINRAIVSNQEKTPIDIVILDDAEEDGEGVEESDAVTVEDVILESEEAVQEEVPLLSVEETPPANATDQPSTRLEDPRVVTPPGNLQERSVEERVTSELLVAAVNQEFSVVIQDTGWIFVSSTGIPVQLLRSIPQAENTVFFFLAQETGIVNLAFERYDLSSGSAFFHTVQVTIVEGILSSEQSSLIVTETTNSFTQIDTLTALSYELSPYEQIIDHLDEGTTLTQNDADVLYTRIANDIANGSIAESLTILRSLLVHDTEHRDKTYFYLGQAYELFSAEQDVERAVVFYRLVQSQFPLSDHYLDAVRRREYIERNFIQIR